MPLKLSTQAFAGALYLTVFLDGADVYHGQLTDEPRKQKQLDVKLREGWNTLGGEVEPLHVAVAVLGRFRADENDPLDDLRYSTVPQR